MEISVTSVSGFASNAIIEFSCRHGSGRGTWMGAAPRLGQEYFVEFNFDQPLRIGLGTALTDDEDPQVYESENQIVFVARIEDIFENGTASLRLGDSLILVDYEGTFPKIGTWLKVTLPAIEIYDAGV